MGAIIFVAFFSLAIFLHEVGHWLLARKLGQNVKSIHFGFGPYLGKFAIASCVVKCHAIPLGGYVNVQTFEQRWKDAITIAAGPLLNFVLAFFFLFAGVLLPSHDDYIGLMYGNQTTQDVRIMDNKPIYTWSQLMHYLMTASIQGVHATVWINQTKQEVIFSLEQIMSGSYLKQLHMMPIMPIQAMTITDVINPCLVGKVKPGDELIAINHYPVNNALSIPYIINQLKSSPMMLDIKDAGQIRQVKFSPGKADSGPVIGLRFMLNPQTIKALAISDAIWHAYMTIVLQFKLQMVAIWGLLTWQVSLDDFSGPLGIWMAFMNQLEHAVWGDFFRLFARINLLVGVFNLLPIPPLDGGNLLVRMLFSSKSIVKWRLLLTRIGLIILIELGIYATLNDVGFLGQKRDVSTYFSDICN